MKIQDLLQCDAEEIYHFILQNVLKTNIDAKLLFDYQQEKFGSLSLWDIIENRLIYPRGTFKYTEYRKDVMPSNIIASSRHPQFCNKSLKDIFLYKKEKIIQLIQYLKIQNQNFAFEPHYYMSLEDPIQYYEVEYCNEKRFIIVTGHHRSLIAYCLQLIDNSYMLKDVEITNITIQWDLIEEKMRLNNLYFDEKKFKRYFNSSRN